MSLPKLFSKLSLSMTINKSLPRVIQTAGLRIYDEPVKYGEIEYPEKRRLKIYDKVPQYPASLRPFKMQKRLRYMRGPELIHNFLLHKQYGVIALIGGRLKYGHFEMMRFIVARKVPSSCFAIYRVDPPWQPVTKKSPGTRMGGGKSAIHHYVTPVKAGRVIMELAGPVEFQEVKKYLKEIADKLPFKAMAVSQEILEKRALEEKRLEEENLNPYTFKYVVQNNLGGCHNWISPVDKLWFGKHR